MTIQLDNINRIGVSKFTPEQKEKIVEEWKGGLTAKLVGEKYNIHPATVSRWSRQLKAGREVFLKGGNISQSIQEVRKLKKDIENLRDVIVSQAHEITLLKKSMKLD